MPTRSTVMPSTLQQSEFRQSAARWKPKTTNSASAENEQKILYPNRASRKQCRESRVRRLNRLPPTGRNPSCHILRRPLWRCWKRNPRQDSPRANSCSQWTSQSTQLDITGHHYTAPALSYQTEQRWSALTSLCRLRRTSGCCDSLMNIWLIS